MMGRVRPLRVLAPLAVVPSPELYRRLSPSQRAGIVSAAATVPLGLVPLLRPRSWLDQSVVTGLSSAASYVLTAALHDVVLGSSDRALRLIGRQDGVARTARATLVVDLCGAGLAAAVQAGLPRRDDESARRALVRAGARMVAEACVAGALPGAVDALPGRLGPRSVLGRALRTVPAAALVGAALGGAVVRLRESRALAAGLATYPERRAPVGPSLDGGALVVLGALAPIWVERGLSRLARAGYRRLTGEDVAGPLRRRVSMLGHGAELLGLVGGLYAFGAFVYRRAEARFGVPDGSRTGPPAAAGSSGSPGSAVDWRLLTREPRRHLAGTRRAARISAVMGEPAIDPLRLYVGLTSAPTLQARVELAMRELDRSGALDRSLLVLCSPTGTGYVNHAAVASWEYLARGDCASLTMQYSVRPSPMSLDRVDDGREQNRAVWAALAQRLREREVGRRPRVALFGESLGAHTSQDAFLHQGTEGLRRAMVDRALWLGTPYASAWPREIGVREPGRVCPDGVLRLTGADAIDELDPTDAQAARYVLIEHGDDAIALFGPELLVREPSWLSARRHDAVPGHARWSTPVTFLQCAVDVKNANATPGAFGAVGHDYRADVARAVSFAFGLPCTPDQLRAIEAALRREDPENAMIWR